MSQDPMKEKVLVRSLKNNFQNLGFSETTDYIHIHCSSVGVLFTWCLCKGIHAAVQEIGPFLLFLHTQMNSFLTPKQNVIKTYNRQMQILEDYFKYS